MGDIADMMIEGLLDWETGEFIDGDAPGYPRTIRDDKRARGPGDGPQEAVVKCPGCNKKCKGANALYQHVKAKHQ